MSGRERKRAERRRRKQRSGRRGAAGPDPGEANGADAGTDPSEPAPDPLAGYRERTEERNRDAREQLEPLAEGQRPRVVTIGAVCSALLSLSIVLGYAAGIEVDGARPTLLEVGLPVALFSVMAIGMFRARYWAVLGFQVVLAFLLLFASLGLVQATELRQVAGNLFLIAVAGTFFWFMVKALARIQMPSSGGREG